MCIALTGNETDFRRLIRNRLPFNCGRITQFALTTDTENFLNDLGFDLGESVSIRILTEIYDGTTDQLLGSTELSLNSDGGSALLQNLDADSLRIRTYGLKIGFLASVGSFFHEFDTVAVQTLLGDCNLDGIVDFLDIQPFISILSNNSFLAQADVDEDGDVDFLDIIPFVAILSM